MIIYKKIRNEYIYNTINDCKNNINFYENDDIDFYRIMFVLENIIYNIYCNINNYMVISLFWGTFVIINGWLIWINRETPQNDM